MNHTILKKICLVVLAISIVSCTNDQSDEYQDILARNIQLEKENKILKDSLSDYQEDFIRSGTLVGIPDAYILKVGKKNKIKVLFHTFSRELPEYAIYKVEDSKEIKIGSNNKTHFDYEFVPKSIDDNELQLRVKIPVNNDTVVTPAFMRLVVEK